MSIKKDFFLPILIFFCNVKHHIVIFIYVWWLNIKKFHYWMIFDWILCIDHALCFLLFIIIFLNIFPFVWHIKNRNLSTANFVFWRLFFLLFDFINVFIWLIDDIFKWWREYDLCDVEIKLLLISIIDLSGFLTDIMRKLILILDTNNIALIFIYLFITRMEPQAMTRWIHLGLFRTPFGCNKFPLVHV